MNVVTLCAPCRPFYPHFMLKRIEIPYRHHGSEPPISDLPDGSSVPGFSCFGLCTHFLRKAGLYAFRAVGLQACILSASRQAGPSRRNASGADASTATSPKAWRQREPRGRLFSKLCFLITPRFQSGTIPAAEPDRSNRQQRPQWHCHQQPSQLP